MVKPTPVRYCPVADRAHLPLETMRLLPTYGAQFRYLPVVQRCLCNSCAHAKIDCDPEVCRVALTEAMTWALTTPNPTAALGGAAKRIFRQYVERRAVRESGPISAEWSAFLDELLDD